jgi:type I restriction enzyme M protein
MARLTQQQLEAHLWGAAIILRGRTAGQDYKTYILSLMFFKRLSDQWDFEADEKIDQLEKEHGRPFTDAQRQALRARGDLHRFTLPVGCHWSDVLKASENVGEVLTSAMRGVANANKELVGVFTVDWNQPAPDGKGKLIANEIVSALVQHFHQIDLSNASVQPDVLGRAYEYLIKQFADDAGAKAGAFFTPPEVVDLLIRILEPQPGETVYDPTCGSGGMLVHSADFLKENGHNPDQLRYYGQELNWSTYAIARINVILHGLEADIRGGKSTITDPQFLRADGSVDHFDLVIANFPFSDEFW